MTSTEEASQLILQALAMGEGGELFVLDMGEPIKIRYMAEQMIRLAGKRKEDVKIEYIGLRPGEKLFEELVHKREELIPTAHTKIMKAHHRNINASLLEKRITQLQQAVNEGLDDEIYKIIKEIVPELSNPRSVRQRLLETEQPSTPAGRLPPRLPAPSASSVTSAGKFTTSQCQKPEPVGASGS